MSLPRSIEWSHQNAASRHKNVIIQGLIKVDSEANETYDQWLNNNFPDVASHPLAERHKRLWKWFASLQAPSIADFQSASDGPRTSRCASESESPPSPVTIHSSPPSPPSPPSSAAPRPRVEVWPRGGAKSATAELACAYLATRQTRKFVLYVSATQAQADLHVQTIAAHLERLGVNRAVSKYGLSRGWRRSQLRTAEGFNVAAYGLDGASRGIKIGRFRPDLIIFDDIDNQSDSAATVRKKIEAITTAIIPTGAQDCAILFLQNLIHEEGVVAQLVDGRADFLHNRQVPPPDPAVRGLKTEIVPLETPSPLWFVRGEGAGGEGIPVPTPNAQRQTPNPDSTPNTEHRTPLSPSPSGPVTHHPSPVTPSPNRYAITAGQATWSGQSLETCERQINEWGLRAFLREAQHEVQAASGYFFDSTKFEIVDDAPSLQRVCLAWDLAATEAGGDHTVAVLMGKAASPMSQNPHTPDAGRFPEYPNTRTPEYLDAPGVFYVLHVQRVQRSSEAVRELILKWSTRVRDRFKNYTIHLPQDPGQAGKAQADSLRRLLAGFQNVRSAPVTGSKAVRSSSYAEQVNLGNVKLLRAPWNAQFIEEHRKFREDESHDHDDQVDAASDAYNDLATPIGVTVSQRIAPNQAYRSQFIGTARPWAEGDDDDDDDDE